jgi:hypothetical protein
MVPDPATVQRTAAVGLPGALLGVLLAGALLGAAVWVAGTGILAWVVSRSSIGAWQIVIGLAALAATAAAYVVLAVLIGLAVNGPSAGSPAGDWRRSAVADSVAAPASPPLHGWRW